MAFQNPVSHPLTSAWTPGSSSSTASSPFFACSREDKRVQQCSAHISFAAFKTIFFHLFIRSTLPLFSHLSFPASPTSTAPLLPDLSPLPSCPLAASCSGSYHFRKRDAVSAQSDQHCSPPFPLALAALNGSCLAPLGFGSPQGGDGGDPCHSSGPILLIDLL